ncbi:protein kinase [Actinomadura sp. 9N407]|uniref:serine/threonine-protein kinase n=1 Tax=Actinomadura sp. 9N407 TaxID=3375154 RepID=UPI0037B2E541
MTTLGGRYDLDPVHIGKGGMGEVWGAVDTRLRRRVAVKLISSPDPELTGRFLRESRLIARMNHPGVPALYDADEADGRLYLVMQLIDGMSLDDLLAEQDPLPIGWAAAVAAQTCAVLDQAHGLLLVHRDLKPSNLMIDRDGAVKVLDFGLAVALDSSERSRFTSSGQMLGTLAYMAPEQVQGAEPSALSDLYSLGCVLYRMLSGRDPFAGPTQASVMHAQIYQHATPVNRLRPDVPPGLSDLVQRLLAKQPFDRPPSARKVYDALLPHIGELPELPGAVRPGTGAVRMYAAITGRTLGPPVPAPAAATAPPADAPFSLGDVARARRQAERLTRDSRYTEAADVLDSTYAQAEKVMPGDHSEMIGLRQDLADVHYKAGEYSQAASAFRVLAQDLAAHEGPDAETVLGLRLHEANSLALSGQTDRALTLLDELLHDQLRVYGETDDRVLDLRRQIGLLLYGADHREEALQTLRDLLTDLQRLNGPDHPKVTDLTRLLDRM